MSGWVFGGIALLLVILAGLLTASLTAVRRIGKSRIRTFSEEGFAGAEELLELRADDKATAPFAVLRILFLLAAVWLGTTAVQLLWSAQWYTGPVVVLAVLVLGELIPRGLGSRRPVRLALIAAPILESGSGILGLVLFPFSSVERLLAGPPPEGDASEDELHVREALKIGTEEGVLEADEHKLVERAFRLDDLTAWDAMTPRVDMFAWEDSKRLEEIVDELESVPYSRVPVYGANIDEVTGILYVREAYQAYTSGQGNVPLGKLARGAFFVPGTLSLTRLLKAFQNSRTHMGIVADEFGGTDGLITLEDVLEELVGDIHDETDLDEESLTRVSRNEILASGGVDLREINDRFGVTLPMEDNRSLNGFLLEEFGEVPAVGASMESSGVVIDVVEASDTQVLKARVRRIPKGPATD